MNEQIINNKITFEEVKDRTNSSQEVIYENNEIISDLLEKEDNIVKDVAKMIDYFRARAKRNSKNEIVKGVNSQIFSQKDLISNKKLMRSRALGNKKKVVDPEIGSEYACKCQMF